MKNKTTSEGLKKPLSDGDSAKVLDNTDKGIKRKQINVTKFLPNAITITAMCFGLSSIRFALYNEWEYAVLCVLASALLDMFDGKVARILDQSSPFGLQLDSLSDLICFGVAPSVILYLISMSYVGKVGWGVCMFLTVCCALRLARFNVAHGGDPETTELDRRYFTGVPAPMGAIIALFPMILFFETESYKFLEPCCIGTFLLLSGSLMVCTLRTFSSKMIEINNGNTHMALIVMAFVIICLVTRLWMSLSVLIFTYILLIPYGAYEYSKQLSEKTSSKV